MKPKSLKELFVLIISLIIPQIIGIVGAITTQRGVSQWYPELVKPFFNPPSWIFGPVWTILYVFIGIVFYILYKANISNKKQLYWLFFLQLFLNGIWSPIFFGLQSLFYAMIVIIILDIVLIYLLLQFRKFNLKVAFYLWIPYVLWVLFATLLTISLWLLN